MICEICGTDREGMRNDEITRRVLDVAGHRVTYCADVVECGEARAYEYLLARHPSEEAVTAAMTAQRLYYEACDNERRKQSEIYYGHPGASIPSAAPDPREAMRRALVAAKDVDGGEYQ